MLFHKFPWWFHKLRKSFVGYKNNIYFCLMSEIKETDFVFSTDFLQINDKRFHDCCLHLICLDGEGSFVFNDRCYHIRRNDAVILVLPDKVCNPVPHPELRVEFFVAPYRFLNSLLPSNNFGIGGGISLYDNPVIPLTETDALCFVEDIHRLRDRMKENAHPFYRELMGSLCQTMIYDLFSFHSKYHGTLDATDRRSFVVKELLQLLQTGKQASRVHSAKCLIMPNFSMFHPNISPIPCAVPRVAV